MNSKVMISYPTHSDQARFVDFYDYLAHLDKPMNSAIFPVHGISCAKNRNFAVKVALENNFTHILFLDDDMIFAPNFLKQLLSHDKDLVCGLCTERVIPFRPVLYDAIHADGKRDYHFLEPNEKGLIRIKSTGLACILIKTTVFKKLIGPPWFYFGQYEVDDLAEDTHFYKRTNEVGIELYCDLDAPVGHHCNSVVTPRLINGEWSVLLNTHDENTIILPMIKRPK